MLSEPLYDRVDKILNVGSSRSMAGDAGSSTPRRMLAPGRADNALFQQRLREARD